MDPCLPEQGDCVLRIAVEVGVEYALIHEVGLVPDREQHPSQVVELQRGEDVRVRRNGSLDRLAVRANVLLGPRLDLGDDREAVICRSLWEDRTVAPLLEMEVTLLRNRHCGGLRPIAGLRL